MRALNPLEQIFWTVDRAAPLNFTFCAHIKGELSFDALRAAIGVQLTRYPALGLSATQVDDRPMWVEAKKIALETYHQ